MNHTKSMARSKMTQCEMFGLLDLIANCNRCLNYVFLLVPECKNAPNIDSNRRIVKVKKEERVILKCFSKLRKDCRESISLNYYWINPQGQLVSSNSTTVMRRNNRVRMKMIITHAQKSDSGNYTCLAKRQSKKAKLTVLLKVE